MRKKVEARKVKRNGRWRWRVILPLDMTGGQRRARYFTSAVDARDFASTTESQRSGCVAEFLVWTPEQQAAAVRALNAVSGDVAALERAVSDYLQNGAVSDRMVEEGVELCLAAKKASGLRSRSLKSLRSTLTRFAAAHASCRIADVSVPQLRTWLDNPKWSPRTRRGYLIDLRTFFSFSQKQGWCRRNLAQDIDKPLVDQPAPCILSVADGLKLLRAAWAHDPGLIPFLAIQMFAGLRPEAEAGRLAWSAVRNGHLDVPSTSVKTRKRRLVPLNATLRAWLGVGAVALRGNLPPTNIAKRMKRVREKAVVTWGHDCLRHSFVSYALPLHGAETVALWAGHSEDVLFSTYRELVTRDQAEAWFGLTPERVAANSGA